MPTKKKPRWAAKQRYISSWFVVALERLMAGEPEEGVLADYGYRYEKKPLAVFDAWAVFHGRRFPWLAPARYTSRSYVQEFFDGGKPIKVRVTVEAMEEK